MSFRKIWSNLAIAVRKLARRPSPEVTRLYALSKVQEYALLYEAACKSIRNLQSLLQQEQRARQELHARKLDVIVGVGVAQKLKELEYKKTVGEIESDVQ